MLSRAVPPRWKIEPRDSSVVLGHSVIIDCQSDADPDPVVTWKKGRHSRHANIYFYIYRTYCCHDNNSSSSSRGARIISDRIIGLSESNRAKLLYNNQKINHVENARSGKAMNESGIYLMLIFRIRVSPSRVIMQTNNNNVH